MAVIITQKQELVSPALNMEIAGRSANDIQVKI
jgi:hypothetical protein